MVALFLVAGNAQEDSLKVHVVRLIEDWREANDQRKALEAAEIEIRNTHDKHQAFVCGYRLIRRVKSERVPPERKWCGLGIGEFEAQYLVRLNRNAPLWIRHRLFHHKNFVRIELSANNL